MLLDAGTIEICRLTNTAAKGDMPAMKLTVLQTQMYGEKTIGYSRQYQAFGVNQQIDLLAMIFDEGFRPEIGQQAIIVDSGNQYRIDNVQPNRDEHGLKIYDLTLSRLEANYDVEQ